MADGEISEEQVFTSAEVCRIAQISSRQLQWWDERKVVSPSHKNRRRGYARQDLFQVLVVAALRAKGLSLQRIRKVLRLLRRDLEQHSLDLWRSETGLYLLTDCSSVHLEQEPQVVLTRMAESRRAMYLVCLSEQVRRIAAAKYQRRRESRQLQLF